MESKIELFVYVLKDLDNIKQGVYDVISTNQTYDESPTIATVKVGDKEIDVNVSKCYWGTVYTGAMFVLSKDVIDGLKKVESISPKEALEWLDPLRPHDMSVQEFLHDEDHGFNGDIREALISAILNDYDGMPLPKKKMDEIMIKAMSRG